MKKIKYLIIVLFLCFAVGCSQSNDNSDVTIANNSDITDSNEKNNDQQQNNSTTAPDKNTEDGSDGQEDLAYFPAGFGDTTDFLFEFEIVAISKTAYNASSYNYNGDAYLAKVKFIRYFNSDLEKRTSYQLNGFDQEFINDMERINQAYDECMQSEYDDEKACGLTFLQEIAIADLDYYVEGGKYIGNIIFPNIKLLDKTTNKSIGKFMDMTDVCNTIKIADEKVYLPNAECLHKEENGKYGCIKAINYMMPESLKLVDGMDTKDFIDWLVKVYNYKMEIFSKNNSCVK